MVVESKNSFQLCLSKYDMLNFITMCTFFPTCMNLRKARCVEKKKAWVVKLELWWWRELASCWSAASLKRSQTLWGQLRSAPSWKQIQAQISIKLRSNSSWDQHQAQLSSKLRSALSWVAKGDLSSTELTDINQTLWGHSEQSLGKGKPELLKLAWKW